MFKYCIIMAAGEGLRLMPLTKSTSKAMIELEGKPIISQSLDQVKSVIENVIVTVGHCGHDLANYVLQNGATMALDTYMRGNAYWLFNDLLKDLNEPILVLPCDNIVKIDLVWLEEEYRRLLTPPCLVIPVKAIEGINGDFVTGENNIVKSLSRTQSLKDHQSIYCSGIQIINPFLVNKLCKFSEDFYQVWASLIFRNQLYYSNTYMRPWYSINTAEQLKEYSNWKKLNNNI